MLIEDALFAVLTEDIPKPTEDINDKNEDQDRVNTSHVVETAPVVETIMMDTRTSTEITDSLNTVRTGNLSNLFKVYLSDDERYSGSTVDNFDRKYVLFQELCDQAGILDHNQARAFSICFVVMPVNVTLTSFGLRISLSTTSSLKPGRDSIPKSVYAHFSGNVNRCH